MNARILPEPDRFAVCPLDGPILPFYDGVFEAAYVLLSPFLRRRSSALVLEDGMPADAAAQDRRDAWMPVRWSEVQRLSGLPTLAAVDVALRTRIGGLKAEFADKAMARQLSESLEQHRLLAPGEGSFPALTLEPMLSFLQSLDQQWLWVGDEFCTERELHWIDDLKPASAKRTLHRENVFTPDKSSLWTVHWDSHFSLFCSTRQNVERLSRHPDLEGFRCEAATEVYWSVRNA